MNKISEHQADAVINYLISHDVLDTSLLKTSAYMEMARLALEAYTNTVNKELVKMEEEDAKRAQQDVKAKALIDAIRDYAQSYYPSSLGRMPVNAEDVKQMFEEKSDPIQKALSSAISPLEKFLRENKL